MHTLLLIRHAKASHFGLSGGDHARPLADKGLAQCKIIDPQMTAANIAVDLALVSTATRTQQTFAALEKTMKNAQVKNIERLYLASAEEIEKQIWLHQEDGDVLAVIGHNPGLAILAWNLLEQGKDHHAGAEEKIRGAFKTAYSAKFAWNGSYFSLTDVFDPRA